MTDLNSLISPSSGCGLAEAGGINDSGQICGYGMNPAGSRTPSCSLPSPSPPPSRSCSPLPPACWPSLGDGDHPARSSPASPCSPWPCPPAVAHADVFNMGGTRDPTTGTWTGEASLAVRHGGRSGQRGGHYDPATVRSLTSTRWASTM